MTVELRPFGVACNLRCGYCYQNPQRDSGNVRVSYDLDRMKRSVIEEGGPFSLFGGEPLLMPLKDLEELWAWGFEQFGQNAVQTNGTLITDKHVALFRRFNVRVGISLDGPGELNDARWHGSLEKTRTSTKRAHEALTRLCREGAPPSLIVTLHRSNATRERLPILYDWVRNLQLVGIRSIRLHLLEVEDEFVQKSHALTTEENIGALLGFLALEKELKTLRFDLFADMRKMLLGDDRRVACVWTSCDPYTTRAVRGIEGHGQRSNCGRTNKDGIDFVKSDQSSFERYLALYQTPQEKGGCCGCKYFLMCKGQCPGTAIEGDWRNRTEHCDVWKTLYRVLEAELVKSGRLPLSQSSDRSRIEREFVTAWETGRNPSMFHIVHATRVSKSRQIPSNAERAEMFSTIEDQLLEWERSEPSIGIP